ncbi:CAP domain-containing protein [Streptomyces sp. NPDC059063]|uniref:CAP domain-containing protein n=1 Tax=unclassified Streptomyces TaxID=2593676 RepID=UPI00369842C6
MGRHRRSAAGRAATGRAEHASPSDSRYADSADADASTAPTGSTASTGSSYADSLYDPELRPPSVRAGRPRPASHRRRGRAAAPVRTGLLGVSAAVAMGAVAVASGLVPGSSNYSLGGGDDAGAIRSASSPAGLDPQGGASGTADRDRTAPGGGSGTGRADTPAPEPSTSSGDPSAKPSRKPSSEPPKRQDGTDDAADTGKGKDAGDTGDTGDKEPGRDKGKGKDGKTPAPPRTPDKPEESSAPPKQPAGDSSPEAQVLALVNQERAKAGCRPVRADNGLASLAEEFSTDMADRGFFAHTDPDGATPWDRAEKAGIRDLGGENIARGQADARSVMDAWLNSPGHRANILNCDYKTLGVGAHFAPGGPWWTQDFGF